METLFNITAFLSFISLFTFVIGFFMLFDKEKRKLGLKLLVGSVIVLVIGFSICTNYI